MEIDNIHIAEEDFDIFLNLTSKDKIEFVSDTVSHGVDAAISKIIQIDTSIPEKKNTQTVNDLFQDTVYEELIHDKHRMNVLIVNNSIHMNSSSLSWIRRMVLKLFMDGHIITRNKFAKKIPGIDRFKYYRCYDIQGSVPPFSLS